jgi:hypothetical protein
MKNVIVGHIEVWRNMSTKDELFNWIQNRTARNVKTMHYDIYCVFPEIFPNELRTILNELIEEKLIVLDNFQYLAVVK